MTVRAACCDLLGFLGCGAVGPALIEAARAAGSSWAGFARPWALPGRQAAERRYRCVREPAPPASKAYKSLAAGALPNYANSPARSPHSPSSPRRRTPLGPSRRSLRRQRRPPVSVIALDALAALTALRLPKARTPGPRSGDASLPPAHHRRAPVS